MRGRGEGFLSANRYESAEPRPRVNHFAKISGETDSAQRFPQYVVSEWIGHDITVSATHYLQVPEELFRKAAEDQFEAASEPVASQSAPKLAPKPPEAA